MPCNTTVLPTHFTAVVEITRCPWIVIASAPPLQKALTTAWMSCWCTTRRSGSMPFAATLDGASSRVTVTAGPVTGVRPTRRACLPSSGARADWSLPASREPVHLLAQRTQLAGQFGVVSRLGLHQADQIGIPGRSQISALCVHRADDDHQSSERAYRRGERTSQRPPISIPASMGVASMSQDRNNRTPGVGDRRFGQVWSLDRAGIRHASSRHRSRGESLTTLPTSTARRTWCPSREPESPPRRNRS